MFGLATSASSTEFTDLRKNLDSITIFFNLRQLACDVKILEHGLVLIILLQKYLFSLYHNRLFVT